MALIRSARQQDVEQLVGLLHSLFTIEEDFNADTGKQRRGLELLLADTRSQVLVAEADDQVVGLCTGQVVISTAEGGPAILVEDMVVAEGYRGQGIGRSLLSGLIDWARDLGATRMQLLADRNNQPALDYYRHLGWQQTALHCWRLYI